jgi:hypothetical protein
VTAITLHRKEWRLAVEGQEIVDVMSLAGDPHMKFTRLSGAFAPYGTTESDAVFSIFAIASVNVGRTVRF